MKQPYQLTAVVTGYQTILLWRLEPSAVRVARWVLRGLHLATSVVYPLLKLTLKWTETI